MGHASHNDHVAMIDLIAPYSRNVGTLAHRGKADRLREVLNDAPAGAREVSADGLTPLFWLPSNDADAIEVVDLLLAHGVDPTHLSPRGLTAAAVARRRGLEGAADRLERAAGTLPAPDADGDPKPGLDHYDALARDLAVAYDTGDSAALARLRAHYGYAFTQDDIRANVWRRVRTVREAKGAASAFQQDEARQIVARDAGFSSWEQFAASMTSSAGTPPPYAIDHEQRTLRLKRRLADRDWDTVLAVMKEHRLTGLEANGLMTDEMMARIAGVDHLTRLELGGSRQLTDAGLQHLRRMPQLQHLDLSEYPGGVITDRGLEPLTDLKELRVFRMCWQRGITDRGCGASGRVSASRGGQRDGHSHRRRHHRRARRQATAHTSQHRPAGHGRRRAAAPPVSRFHGASSRDVYLVAHELRRWRDEAAPRRPDHRSWSDCALRTRRPPRARAVLACLGADAGRPWRPCGSSRSALARLRRQSVHGHGDAAFRRDSAPPQAERPGHGRGRRRLRRAQSIADARTSVGPRVP